MVNPPKLGHSLIDAQHTDLCHCIGMLKSLAAKRGSQRQIDNILANLSQMLRLHFETEEAVMVGIGMPAELLVAHCAEHRNILTELDQFQFHGESAEDADYDLAEVSLRVSIWVDSHLNHFDREIVPYLVAKTAEAESGELSA